MHLEDKKVFSPELGFPVDFTSKQTNPQMALCPQRHMVCEMLWDRSEAPLCGVSECSAHISSVTGFGLLKPKIGSVFHHGRQSCRITDEQGLSRQQVTAA